MGDIPHNDVFDDEIKSLEAQIKQYEDGILMAKGALTMVQHLKSRFSIIQKELEENENEQANSDGSSQGA